MHETVLMQNLITTAEQALVGHHITKVNRINISVGKLSNVLPDAMRFAFEALTQEGVFVGAELEMAFLPIVACCEICRNEYQTDGFPIVCPECGSNQFKIIAGEEVYIDSIDCEEE